MSAEGQLGEILELIRASSSTEREQIFAALAKEGDLAANGCKIMLCSATIHPNQYNASSLPWSFHSS